MAIERVRYRVSQGGHNIPENDIRRRFSRSRLNFDNYFKSIVDACVEFDTSSSEPILIRSYKDEK
jgi:predicted ABC-type ATPase